MMIEHVSSVANWLSIVFILSGLYLWLVPLTGKIKDNKKRKSRHIYIVACVAMLIFIFAMAYKHYNAPVEPIGHVETNVYSTVKPTSSKLLSNRQTLLRKPRQRTFTDVLNSKKEMEFWNILSSNAGTYNGCTGPTLWVIMGGHMRSADLHVLNTKAFLEQSHTCTFLIYVLRRYVAEHSLSNSHKFADGSPEWKKWTSINTTARAEYLLATIGTNAAYIVTHRTMKGGWAHMDTRIAGLVAIRELQKQHGISSSTKDIVVHTRPDAVFSHAIDIATLIQVKERFQMYIPHYSGSTGTGNDPNELFFIATLSLYFDQFDFCQPQLSLRNGDYPGVLSYFMYEKCDSQQCDGDKIDQFMEQDAWFNANSYYVRPDFDIIADRLDDSQTCFNAPCGAMTPTSVQGILDFTQNVRQVWPGKKCFPAVLNTDRKKALMWQQVSQERMNIK